MKQAPIIRCLRSLVLSLGILFTGLITTGCHNPEPVQHREARPLMGTVVEITTEGPDTRALATATDAAYHEMMRLSDMMNHYNPDSAVSAINRAASKHPVRVPRELMQVLSYARAVSERTGGAFDITIGSLKGWRFDPEHPAMPAPTEIAALLPRVNYRHLILDENAGSAYLKHAGMRIDLGGIAKLPILAAGMDVLKQHAVSRAMINGGGDVMVTTQGRPWRVGIRNPLRPDALFAVVELQRGFVVSSGDYERYFVRDGKRYHHILDPRTGFPTQGPRGVALISQDMELVNGLSSAIMVTGARRGRALIEQHPALEGIIFNPDGSTWVSPTLAQRLIILAKENPAH